MVDNAFQPITKHSVMTQVVDAAGNPLRVDLKGNHGLEELSEVVIDGKVTQTTDKLLIVNATGMFIVQR